MPDSDAILSWLHIGDLHLVDADAQNHRDLRRIVALVGSLPPGSLDFALLPGDNADDGTPGQFKLVRDAVAPLRLPLHVLPGDHDFKPGSLAAFYEGLAARRLPYAVRIGGHRCLFLDVVSAGAGGPDFRLGDDQLAWIERELEQASGEAAMVFMHTYPADLSEGGERLGALFDHPHVRCVDMGHTHYNELANDGSTIFMATRSTGQVEEGPSGFSIAAVDGRCVSWRFKPLDRAWPFVLITSPADRRLVTGPDQVLRAGCTVRAKVIGDVPVEAVTVRLDDGEPRAMLPVPGRVGLWQAACDTPAGRVRVEARDARGRLDADLVEPARSGWTLPDRIADGSDRDRVGAWPEKGILGTQLGPNRNGRHW